MSELEAVPVDRFSWERAIRDDEEITGNLLLVLLTLATYMDKDGSRARPSLNTIASKTGLHSATCGRHLKWARGNGWLEQTSRGHRRGDGISVASVHRATVALPRNESDVERALEGDVEDLYRAADDLYRAEGGSLPRTHCATTTVFEDHGLTTHTTALCADCDDDGMRQFEALGRTISIACDHPNLGEVALR